MAGSVAKNWFVAFWRQPRLLSFRKAAFYVHMVLGLSVGLLASIVCLTGSLIVYKPEIESLTLGPVSHLVPTADRRTVPLQSAYDMVRQKEKGCRITQAYLHAAPDLVWSFDLNCKPRGRIVVYIDNIAATLRARIIFRVSGPNGSMICTFGCYRTRPARL